MTTTTTTEATRAAWVGTRPLGTGYVVRVGAGLFDFAPASLAAAVTLARGQGAWTVHLPMAV